MGVFFSRGLSSSGREISAPDMMIAGDDNSRGLFDEKLFFEKNNLKKKKKYVRGSERDESPN